MLRIDIISLFPQICAGAFSESMLKRAQQQNLVSLRSHNLRDWTRDKHRTADGAPYGGGQGMVLKPEPFFEAVEQIKASAAAEMSDPRTKVLLMSPGGRRFNQETAAQYAGTARHLIILCGHYEGVDQRVIDHLVDDEISIGDYVLTNGAIAAVVFVDAVVRLIPGVLGDAGSAADDSFSTGLLEYPQFTRPVEYRGWRVPEILLSGHHAEIAEWRRAQALEKTRRVRPDLME